MNEITLKQAYKNIVSLSVPSKIPGYCYSIPAQYCKTGSKLRTVANSVCSDCYALKGNYRRFPSVFNAMDQRYNKIVDDLILWRDSMVIVINSDKVKKHGIFRWHDSGDLQSIEHLDALVYIAKKIPSVKFWIPTREYKIVQEYLKKYLKFPDNFILRISAHIISKKAPNFQLSSTVNYNSNNSFNCVAASQGGKCLDCRACWNGSIKNINYQLH